MKNIYTILDLALRFGSIHLKQLDGTQLGTSASKALTSKSSCSLQGEEGNIKSSRFSMVAAAEKQNQTCNTEFILLGFGDSPDLQVPLFLLFLVIYVVTMMGNILILTLVVADQRLHSPMYFFLSNLSCLEMCSSSTILPKLLASFLTGDRTTSYSSCLTQFFVFTFLVGVECYLLAVMSYDQYLAVCKPLHYVTLMNPKLCIALAAGSWIEQMRKETKDCSPEEKASACIRCAQVDDLAPQVAELQETPKRLCSVREAEMEKERWLQNHAPIVDTTENEAPWILVTCKSRLNPPESQLRTDMKL
ncbi:hypothetical protein AV530_014157 [Patagioenas fasciata monilis]|uniref:G-protein coupled receptors family 1 profile domain-containing protein n=1 Tax=Patagioenas fasciata monilis TaxID=372326 RepID=A0A1V4KE97_PATFA|nr:hypothetical protein AV530_014157 [Patagioenas fasciata monilis]